MTCEHCKYWKKLKDTTETKNMGKCKKISAKKGKEYPDIQETGIDGYPICVHDGACSDFETKSWFSCIHFSAIT
jgi:hypothetical protein